MSLSFSLGFGRATAGRGVKSITTESAAQTTVIRQPRQSSSPMPKPESARAPPTRSEGRPNDGRQSLCDMGTVLPEAQARCQS